MLGLSSVVFKKMYGAIGEDAAGKHLCSCACNCSCHCRCGLYEGLSYEEIVW